MFKSIRWRLSALYFVLVFIAMTIVGVFVSDRLEDYNLGLVRENLLTITNSAEIGVVPEDINAKSSLIQQNMEKISLPVGYNIYLINPESYEIVATSNKAYLGRNSMEVLNSRVLMTAITEGFADLDVHEQGDGLSMSKIYAKIMNDNMGNRRLIIYSTASLNSVYSSLRATTRIIINASVVALLVALVVGYIISGSITTPINELNDKAKLIARGDFRQRVETKSTDEIGTLGNTFNYLAKRLDTTLIEMSTERNRLDAIINNMADGLLAVDDEGTVVMYNKTLPKLLQSRGIVFYSNNLDSIAEELGIDLRLSDIKNSIENNEVASFVVETRQRVLRVSCAYFNDDMRKQNGFILLFQDITEAKQLDDMRKEFVANVSHELKTPITTIKTYAETLSGGNVDDPQVAMSFLETIEKEADRMTALVRDLLQLSHIDFKKTKWEMGDYDLYDMIAECKEHLKIYYTEKKQSIVLPEKTDYIVHCDKSKIKQVFINILSNAVKYTADDGRIEVKMEKVSDMVEITIKDNGIGIPSEDVSRVFERFYRVDKGRSRQQGGTGLGLSIAQDIVQAHGGQITAKSEVGIGSQFTVTLPLKKD